jgi:HlyD family secretion protein
MIFFEKFRWPLALILVLIAGMTYAFWPRAIEADIETVSAGSLSVTVDDDGITRIREVYTVTMPVTGRILRINIHAGDQVVAGKTVLASILPGAPALHDERTQLELKAALKVAQESKNAALSQVDGAKADLDFAKIESDRANLLYKNNAVSAASVDKTQHALRTTESALATAHAVLSQRESELKKAEAALFSPVGVRESSADCCLDITAPESGLVLKVFQENEMVVPVGSPLLEIGDRKNLEIVTDILSRDALKISPGDPVIIENWGGDGVLDGKVRLIEPAGTTKVSSLGIEEQRVNVIIDITNPHDKWSRLGHGYQVDTRIVVWQGDHVIKVPLAALFRQGNDWAVFRNENGIARILTVKIGHVGSQYAEVLEGLVSGDQIILHPGGQISNGVRIRNRS